MNTKKVVLRMDLLTRKSYPRNQLIRLVLIDGKLILDLNHKILGRGIYLLNDGNTLEKVFKKGLLKRYCKDEEVLENLKREIQDANR